MRSVRIMVWLPSARRALRTEPDKAEMIAKGSHAKLFAHNAARRKTFQMLVLPDLSAARRADLLAFGVQLQTRFASRCQSWSHRLAAVMHSWPVPVPY